MKFITVSPAARRVSTAVLAAIPLLAIGALPGAARGAHMSGGVINVRAISAPVCLDPSKAVSGPEGTVLQPAGGALLQYNQKGKLVPDLATKWQVSRGGKWITVTVRPNVRFSNGDLVDANAVKVTLQRVLKAPTGKAQMGPLSSVKVLSKYVARLVLKTPDRPVLNNLANTYLVDPRAVAKEGDQKFCQYPVLAGPFAITNVGPGFDPVTLKRNPYRNWEEAWQPNHGAPYLNGLSVYPIASDATAVSELLSGQLDITNVPGSQLGRVQGNPSVVLHKRVSDNNGYLFFNLAHAPFNNKEVRKAFAESIDRTAVIKAVLNGLGVPATGPFAKGALFYDKNSTKYVTKYNPTDARRIFQANHITGPFTFLSLSIPIYSGVAELVQGELAQEGVKVNIEEKEVGAWIDALQHGQYDISFNTNGFSDPDFVMYALYDSSQATSKGYNFVNLKDPTVDDLLMQGRTSLNQKKAAAAYARLQKYFDTNNLTVPLYTPVTVTGVRSRVGGWTTDRFGAIQYQDLYIKGKH